MGPERLDYLINRLGDYLDHEAEQIVEQASSEQTEYMADLNRQQLLAGERSDGSIIEPPYTLYTKLQKRKFGQPTDKVTLLMFGHYHAGILPAKYNFGYEFMSTDYKDERLQGKYGELIVGLQEDNIVRVSEAMLPMLIDETHKFLTEW